MVIFKYRIYDKTTSNDLYRPIQVSSKSRKNSAELSPATQRYTMLFISNLESWGGLILENRFTDTQNTDFTRFCKRT